MYMIIVEEINSETGASYTNFTFWGEGVGTFGQFNILPSPTPLIIKTHFSSRKAVHIAELIKRSFFLALGS